MVLPLPVDSESIHVASPGEQPPNPAGATFLLGGAETDEEIIERAQTTFAEQPCGRLVPYIFLDGAHTITNFKDGVIRELPLAQFTLVPGQELLWGEGKTTQSANGEMTAMIPLKVDGERCGCAVLTGNGIAFPKRIAPSKSTSIGVPPKLRELMPSLPKSILPGPIMETPIVLQGGDLVRCIIALPLAAVCLTDGRFGVRLLRVMPLSIGAGVIDTIQGVHLGGGIFALRFVYRCGVITTYVANFANSDTPAWHSRHLANGSPCPPPPEPEARASYLAALAPGVESPKVRACWERWLAAAESLMVVPDFVAADESLMVVPDFAGADESLMVVPDFEGAP